MYRGEFEKDAPGSGAALERKEVESPRAAAAVFSPESVALSKGKEIEISVRVARVLFQHSFLYLASKEKKIIFASLLQWGLSHVQWIPFNESKPKEREERVN